MRKIIAALSVMAVLTLAGCSGGNLQHRAYIRAAAVENGRVAFAFFDDTEPVTVDTNSLAEALKEAELRCGMDIFTGYTELIVLGDCPGEQVLSGMLTDWRVSPECIVAGSRGSACDLLTGGSAELIEDSAKQAAKLGKSPNSGIITVLSGLLSEENSAILPLADNHGVCGELTIRGD